MKTKLQLLASAFMLAFGMSAQDVSITGTGTGGWNQPGGVIMTATDGVNYSATNFKIAGDKNMKFSEGSWATTGGFSATTAPGFPTGTVVLNGGSNIVGTGGVWANPLNNNYWNATYNKTTKEYAFTEGINPYKIYTVSGGGLAAPVTLSSSNGIAYAQKSLYFAGGNAQFNEVASPINPVPSALTWGGPFPTTGANPASTTSLVAVPAGFFNVYFSRTTGVPTGYTFEPTVVGLIGNFAGSSWGGDIDLTTTDGINYCVYNKTFTPGGPVATPWTDPELHVKFRDNHDWTNQFGCNGANGANALALTGTAQNGAAGGGGDIFVPWPTAGNAYDVCLNRLTGTWTFTVVPFLATNSFDAKNFSVAPNPTNTTWNFTSKSNSQINSVQIIDILGKVISTTTATSNEVTVDASNLNTGIYFAKVASANGTATVKVVRN